MKIDLAMIRAFAAEIGTLTDDENTYLDTLDGETDVMDLIDSGIAAMRDDEALAEAIRAQEQALRSRRTRIEMRGETHRKMLLCVMQAAGIRKAERAAATLSLRPGSVSVKITDEADIPTQLKRVKTVTEPDKLAIKAALQAGENVPGAALETGPEALAVRVA